MVSERTKSIRIRISEEEFLALNEACERTGTKTVIDLAREAMHYLVETHNAVQVEGQNARPWLGELVCRLTSLQAEIERLERLLKVRR